MVDKTMGLEVEVSNIHFKFPKLTTAALAMPVLLLLFQIPDLDTEPSLEPVARPAAPSQPEATVKVSPATPALPDYLESTETPQESLALENESGVSTDSLSETAPSVELVADSAPVSGSNSFIAGTCSYLKTRGLGPFYEGDINYTTKRDRDNDGIACE